MPPRLIFINRFFYPDLSATSQMLSDLAFALAADWEVEVITSRQRYDDPSARLPALEQTRGVTVRRVWGSHFGRYRLLGRLLDYLSFYFGAGLQLWRDLRPGDVVVVKTDPPLLSVWVAPLVRWRRARLVNWLQDLFPEVAAALGVRLVRGRSLGLLRGLRNRSLRQAGCNVVLGEIMRQRLCAEGIEPERIRVIPNWADGAAVYPLPPALNPLRAAWGLEAKFVLGYSGNLGRAHQFHTLLEAATLLRQRADIVFLCIGSGPQHAWLQTEARRRGLDNLRFQPYQARERLHQSLSLPDLHLVSLRPALEGLIVPSKFYGIAAAGRGSLYLGDPDGEIPRLLRRHHCGLSFSETDSVGLAAAITRLAAEPQTVRVMGQRARHLFEQQFDFPIALRAWRAALAKTPD